MVGVLSKISLETVTDHFLSTVHYSRSQSILVVHVRVPSLHLTPTFSALLPSCLDLLTSGKLNSFLFFLICRKRSRDFYVEFSLWHLRNAKNAEFCPSYQAYQSCTDRNSVTMSWFSISVYYQWKMFRAVRLNEGAWILLASIYFYFSAESLSFWDWFRNIFTE